MFGHLWDLDDESRQLTRFSRESDCFGNRSKIIARESSIRTCLLSTRCQNGSITAFKILIGDANVSHIITWPREETANKTYFVRLVDSVIVSVITVLKVKGASVIRMTFPWQEKSVFASIYVDTKMGFSIIMSTG